MTLVDSVSGRVALLIAIAILGLYFFGGRLFDPEGEARRATIEQASRDSVYREVCPDYFNAGFMERISSNLRWCEAYRGKI